jgi:hypothetical protein
MWLIFRHVASVNRTVQIYPEDFHHGKSRSLVTRTPDSAIPDFPKWEISRHVASLNRTVQICLGVSTMESPDLSSPGLPIRDSRFPEMGDLTTRSLLEIGRSKTASGFPPWNIPISRHQNSEFSILDFPKWEILRHVASVVRTV